MGETINVMIHIHLHPGFDRVHGILWYVLRNDDYLTTRMEMLTSATCEHTLLTNDASLTLFSWAMILAASKGGYLFRCYYQGQRIWLRLAKVLHTYVKDTAVAF
jgi:hypothetical protein